MRGREYVSFPAISLSFFFVLTDIQYAVEIEVLVAAWAVADSHMIIHGESVSLRGRSADADGVPLAVVQLGLRGVLDPDGPVAQVEHVVHVSVNQLDRDEVTFPSGVIKDQAVRFARLKLKSNVYVRMGYQNTSVFSAPRSKAGERNRYQRMTSKSYGRKD